MTRSFQRFSLNIPVASTVEGTWRTVARFSLLALVLSFTAVGLWAQNAPEITVSNATPLEGPAAGNDQVLIYATAAGSQNAVSITTDADWITLSSSSVKFNVGANRFYFQLGANTSDTRVGHIQMNPADGSQSITMTVTQAGAGFTAAGPVTLVKSINGPSSIDVDPLGNVYIVDSSGTSLWKWTAATQQVTSIANNRPNFTFQDVAIDSAGDVFALEFPPDGSFGTQIEQLVATQGQLLPPNNIVFSSESTNYLYPRGMCVDATGKNLNVTTADVGDKCLIDQFGTVYQLDTVDDNENLGSFASAPTNADYSHPPIGQVFFPVGANFKDPCGNKLPSVTGSLYGLSKDGDGYLYFADQNGSRLNRYDPGAPWSNCVYSFGNGVTSAPISYGGFTTIANLTQPAYYTAADTVGDIYLSDMPFDLVQEIPRAYLSSVSPVNLPVQGGTATIQILPVTQNLSGVFAPISSDSTWLTATASNGVVTISASPNPGKSRTGTVTVLGVPISVVEGETQTPTAMAIISGDGQQAAVGGAPFPTNLLVKVFNTYGDAAANVPVTFTSATQTLTVNTSQRGYAAATGFTATGVGPMTVTASVAGTTVSQVFHLTGTPNGIAIFSGSNQKAEIGGLFGGLTVQVFDANGQPLAGVPVTFSAPTSGPSGSFEVAAPNSTSIVSSGSTVTVNTGLTGLASTSLVGPFQAGYFQANGTAGSFVVTASISNALGLQTDSVGFNLVNYGAFNKVSADESTLVDAPFSTPLSASVLDANGNPVANASVTFVVNPFNVSGATAATFSNGGNSDTVNTDANGIATSLPLTAASTAGSFTAYASYNSPAGQMVVSWNLTNQASTILEGAIQNGPSTRTFAQPMIVKSSANPPVGSVVFTVVPGATGASGSFNGQNSVTVNLDSQGYAIAPLLTANAKPGTFTVNAYDGVSTVQGTFTTTQCLNPTNPSVAVTSTDDYNPDYQPDTTSLRYVLANACAGSTIDMSQLNGTIKLQSRLRLDDSMTLLGPGADKLAIDGGGKTRLFFIGNGVVTFSNLTLQNGLAQGGSSVFGGGGAGMGGAIFMQGGNVTLSNMLLTGNVAVGGGSGTATPCSTNCEYGGGGFAGNAISPETGGNSGDLFGLAGPRNGESGDIGGGGAGAGSYGTDTLSNGGNGGFGAGGGAGRYIQGQSMSGNGGFGGGGGGGAIGCNPPNAPNCSELLGGVGGYGAGNGYAPAVTNTPNFGGSGAGFGGAIFQYSGTLTLNSVQFLSNSAMGGTLAGLTGQPASVGQGKGGALFIYNGAVLNNINSSFGSGDTANIAADAGAPGHGNSNAPYTNGATCPGQDTVDICGQTAVTTSVSINVPTGVSFVVNGATYNGSQSLALPPGQYTLSVVSPQPISTGVQSTFSSWSDGGAQSHTITVGASALSVTASFTTQYLLTTAAGSGGIANPAAGYYNAGTVVNLNAAANPGYVFTSWTGNVVAAGSPATTVTMNSPQSVTATFIQGQQVNIVVPPAVSYQLNGVSYAGPQTVTLPLGAYTLATTTPQTTPLGDQQMTFASWSDGGALAHSIMVASSPVSITGNFATSYLLKATAGSGGTIGAVNGFYSSGTVVNLTATPNQGYVFHNWGGTVASPESATTTVTMTQAQTVVANFWPAASSCASMPNITAWWKGDGTANDQTGKFNATMGGDANFAAGLVGQAFSFDGTQSPYVALPAEAFPAQPSATPFSFDTWFQTAGGSGGVILGQQAGAPYTGVQNGWSPAIYVGTDGKLYVEMFYSGSINQFTSAVAVNDNQWHHVAVTYDGSTESAYLDGSNFGQLQSFSQAPNGSPLSYQLGTGYTASWPASNGSWYTFNGLIDEPTIYSSALTATQVLQIAQAGGRGKCVPSGTVTAIITASNKAYDGTLSATTTCSLQGVLPADASNVACSAANATFANVGPASGIQVTATGIALTGSAASHYFLAATTATTSANITPDVVTPTIVAQSKLYDGTTNASVTCSLNGVAATDQGNVSCTVANAQFATSVPGNYVQVTATGISLTGPAAGNYQLSTTTATTTGVIEGLGTITFPQIPNQVVGTQYTLNATSNPPGPITYTTSDGSVCSASGSVLTLLSNGSCVVTASQSGVTPVARAFYVYANFADTAIGSTSSAHQVVFTFETGTTLSSTPLVALTQGVPNLDFQIASTQPASGACQPGQSYNPAQSCTVNVTFTPTKSGMRLGAVELLGSNGNVVATEGIGGTGVGAKAGFATFSGGAYVPTAQTSIAGFTAPNALAVDGQGNIFVADPTSGTVSEAMAPDYSTVKPIGTGFNAPRGIAVDGAGNVYVSDTFPYSTGGTLKGILAAGGYTSPISTVLAFQDPRGLAFDATGNIFLAEYGNNAIREVVAPYYSTVLQLGSGFSHPSSVAVDALGNVFVADTGNNAVKEILVQGGYTTVTTLATFNQPTSVAVDGADNVFVAESGSNDIKEMIAAGGYSTILTLGSNFSAPSGIALNNGNVIVADTNHGNVVTLNYATPPALNFASTNVGQTSSDSPQAVLVGNVGNAALTGSYAVSNNWTQIAGSGNVPDCSASSLALASGSFCNLSLSFTPMQSGSPLSGSVTFASSSTNSLPSIALSGTAVTASLTPVITAQNKIYDGTTNATVTCVLQGALLPGDSGNVACSVGSAAFAAPTPGNAVTVNATGITLTGAAASHYSLSSTTAAATANISPLSITPSIAALNKAYDGTTNISANCVLTGVIAADQGQISCTAANVQAANAGPGYAIQVTATGITLAGPVSGNYILTSTTATTTTNITTGGANPTACVAAPSGLTASWKGEGDATDLTGSFNATSGGDVSFAAGQVGQAFNFDGTQSPFVSLPAGAFPTEPGNGPFSFEAWFQTSNTAGGVIFGEQSAAPYTNVQNGWTPAIYVGADGHLYVEMFYTGSVNPMVSEVPVNDAQWHHVAVTYDGSNEIAYLDGVSIGQQSNYTQAPNGSPLSYQLGTGYTYGWPSGNGGWYTFKGLIDEASVYSRALTAGEVAGIFQAASYGKCAPVTTIVPGSLSLGSVGSSQSATQSAAVANTGNAPLVFTSITLDAGDTNFTLLGGNAQDCALGTPVQPGASCNLRVQFAPQGSGSLTGVVTVKDNSVVGAGIQTIALSGTVLLSQSITFNAIAPQVVGATLDLAATATSNLTVIYNSSTPAVCGVSGNAVTMLTAGQCSITASQPGNAVYAAAVNVTQTFDVQSTQTITFGTIAPQMIGAQLTLTASASSGLPVAFTSTTPNYCTVSGSAVTLLAAGTCTITASQQGSSTYLPAASVTQSFTITTSGGLGFFPIPSCRAVDTRGTTGPMGGPSLAGGATRIFALRGLCGLPANATAYSLNITVVPHGELKYLTVWPTSATQPVVSTLNSYDGRVVANAAIVPAGSGGAINVYATNNTDVIIDVNGYFGPAGNAGAMSFVPVTPCRVEDTRQAHGPFGGPALAANSSRSFVIPSSNCGIPANGSIAAYSLNETVVPTSKLGYLTVYPTGASKPATSTLNAMSGQVVANAALVSAGTNGAVTAYVTDQTQLITDINGYFTNNASTPLVFQTVTPCRVVDTRNATGPLGGPILSGNTKRSFPISTSSCGIPANAAAYALNVTVVPTGSLNYLTVWADGTAQPLVSTLNSDAGAVVANAAIVQAGATGAVDVFATDRTHVIMDIVGYFAAP